MSSDTSNAFAGPWKALDPPLSSWILQIIKSLNLVQMTPVQAATIPLFMKHKDVVVEAVTGSGKTLAFVIPVLERLYRREQALKKTEVGAIIISPTRELATQIFNVLSQFVTLAPEDIECPKPLLLVSGTESTPLQDISRFLETSADIIIGTPGRIEEFLLGRGGNNVNIKELEVLVLDEADRLLDLGFTKTLTRILHHLPRQRRTGLFSATMTDGLTELARVGLRNPVRVVVKVEAKKSKAKPNGTSTVTEERRTPANLQMYYAHCEAEEKSSQLINIINHERSLGAAKFIVYFATCAAVDYFYRIFSRVSHLQTFDISSLHGHLTPERRAQTLASFTAHPSTTAFPSILLCTDVAARGLDLPDVDMVVQYDCPTDTKTFSHRAGRTARMGRDGKAWVILVGREIEYVDLLQVRMIPVKQGPPLASSSANMCTAVGLREEMRTIVLRDRDLHEKGTKAFVSFAQAYSKHEASYVFRLRDLNLVGIANSYGLLKLPRMPELKGKTKGWNDADVDWASYAYSDKARETKRLAAEPNSNQADNQHQSKKQRREQMKQNAAWSHKAEVKQNREVRKLKRERKKAWERAVHSQQIGSETTKDQEESAEKDWKDGARSKSQKIREGEADWEEFLEEERAAKKAKREKSKAKVIASTDIFLGL